MVSWDASADKESRKFHWELVNMESKSFVSPDTVYVHAEREAGQPTVVVTSGDARYMLAVIAHIAEHIESLSGITCDEILDMAKDFCRACAKENARE